MNQFMGVMTDPFVGRRGEGGSVARLGARRSGPLDRRHVLDVAGRLLRRQPRGAVIRLRARHGTLPSGIQLICA
jgi:hypothetical protein